METLDKWVSQPGGAMNHRQLGWALTPKVVEARKSLGSGLHYFLLYMIVGLSEASLFAADHFN